MQRRALGWLALVMFVVATRAMPARATIVEALDLRGLVSGAELVVLGTVIRVESSYDDFDRIVTDAEVRIDQRMYGGAQEGATVIVRRVGGAIGDVGLRIEGEPILVPGETLVLFAAPLPGNERILRPVGMSQGVLPVERRGGVEMVLPGGHGLALMQRAPDGALRSGAPAMGAPIALDEVLARIRDIVAEVHAPR